MLGVYFYRGSSLPHLGDQHEKVVGSTVTRVAEDVFSGFQQGLIKSCASFPNVPLLPSNTKYEWLNNKVYFYQWPRETGEEIKYDEGADENGRVSVFIGQLPYETSYKQIKWIVNEFGKCKVYGIGNCMQGKNTGCVFVDIPKSELENLIKNLHKRILFDITGLWYANDNRQFMLLNKYENQCRSIHRKKEPYLRIVVEETDRETRIKQCISSADLGGRKNSSQSSGPKVARPIDVAEAVPGQEDSSRSSEQVPSTFRHEVYNTTGRIFVNSLVT